MVSALIMKGRKEKKEAILNLRKAERESTVDKGIIDGYSICARVALPVLRCEYFTLVVF